MAQNGAVGPHGRNGSSATRIGLDSLVVEPFHYRVILGVLPTVPVGSDSSPRFLVY